MRVTVTLGSSRPGGLDVSLLGLAAQTFEDFEVVFVDGLYHLRHAEVLSAVKASGLRQPFFHVPNHRYNPAGWQTISAGFNTGFALAAGEIIIMLCDYAFVRPDWIEQHVASHSAPRVICAPHQYRKLPALKLGSLDDFEAWPVHPGPDDIGKVRAQWARFLDPECLISTFRDPPTRASLEALDIWGIADTDGKWNKQTGPIGSIYFHTKNESFPRASVFEVNGMDENWDRGSGPGDPEICRRLEKSGLQVWLCREADVLCCNPRPVLPNPNITLGHTARPDGRWVHSEGLRYFDLRESYLTANNPFSLRDLSDEIWDWRERCQSAGAVLPHAVVADADYFAACPMRFP
jgi:hypothetical protein